MKKCLLMLLMAALFSLLLFSAAAAIDANPVTREEFEDFIKNPSPLTIITEDPQIPDPPKPDFSNPSLTFKIPAQKVRMKDSEGNLLGEQVIPLDNTTAAVHPDVALLIETKENWITGLPQSRSIPLTAGSYTLSGSGDLSAGNKVLVVETDGTMNAFVSGGVSNGVLAVGDDSLEVCTCIAAMKSLETKKAYDVDKDFDLGESGHIHIHGTIYLDYDIESGWEPYGYYLFVNNASLNPDMDYIEVDLKKEIHAFNTPIIKFEIPIIEGVFGIDISPCFFIDVGVEGDVSFSLKAGTSMGAKFRLIDLMYLYIDDVTGSVDTPDASLIACDVGGEIYTGLEWGPSFSFVEGVVQIGVNCRVGPVIEGFFMDTPFYPDDEHLYRYHACRSLDCAQGDVHLRVGPATIFDKVVGSESTLYTIMNPIDYDPFTEFYYSHTYGEGSVEHQCPHHGYLVKTYVVDQDGTLLPKALAGYVPYEDRFEPVAHKVARGEKGYWGLYVPKSYPAAAGKDSNTVTITAYVQDPLDPTNYLSGTAVITEKGQKDKKSAPDPEQVTVRIDESIVTIYFLDSGSGATNMPAPVQFHPFISPGAHLPDIVPVKGGNAFIGWNTKRDGSGKWYRPGAYVETDTDLELYAQFRILSNQYVVVYNANGGVSAPEPQLGTLGIPITLTRERAVGKGGMLFLGWSLTPDGADEYKPGDQFTCPAGETVAVLYAVWTFDPLKVVKIHYDLNGGVTEKAIPDRWIQKNASFQITEVTPEKLGSVFLGWSLKKDAATADYKPGRSYHFTKDTTLYAVYQPTAQLQVTVTFDLNGGPPQEVPVPMTVRKSLWVPIPETRLSWDQFHRFEGWSTDPKALKADYFPGRPANFMEDTTLYAVWVPYYTITFDPNGGETDGNSGKVTMIVRRGTIITIPKAPFRYKYQFLYWRGSRYNPGDRYAVWEDHTFTAEWKKKPPKTGDDAPLLLWGGLLLLGILGMGGLAASRRLRKHMK